MSDEVVEAVNADLEKAPEQKWAEMGRRGRRHLVAEELRIARRMRGHFIRQQTKIRRAVNWKRTKGTTALDFEARRLIRLTHIALNDEAQA